MKKLYFNDYQLKEIAMFASRETISRWQAKPVELLELASRLEALAEAAPNQGKITVTGEYMDDSGEVSEVTWESPRALLLNAASFAKAEAQERLRSTMALFKDLIDPIPSPHRTIVFKAECRD